MSAYEILSSFQHILQPTHSQSIVEEKKKVILTKIFRNITSDFFLLNTVCYIKIISIIRTYLIFEDFIILLVSVSCLCVCICTLCVLMDDCESPCGRKNSALKHRAMSPAYFKYHKLPKSLLPLVNYKKYFNLSFVSNTNKVGLTFTNL